MNICHFFKLLYLSIECFQSKQLLFSVVSNRMQCLNLIYSFEWLSTALLVCRIQLTFNLLS